MDRGDSAMVCNILGIKTALIASIRADIIQFDTLQILMIIIHEFEFYEFYKFEFNTILVITPFFTENAK